MPIPQLPPPLPDAEPKRLTPALVWALVAVGGAQFAVGVLAPYGSQLGFLSGSIRVGVLFGSTIMWPAIMCGLFALAKPYRNSRTLVQVVTAVWSAFIILHATQFLSSSRFDFLLSPQDRLDLSESFTIPEVFEGGASESEALFDTEVVPPEPVVESPDAVDWHAYDFSPGSDERLFESISNAQEISYHEVVAAYEAACAANPDDAVLALERFQFVSRFAYSEDLYIESAAKDYEAAEDYLTSRFPETPGAVLHLLSNTFDPGFAEKARKYARLILNWGPKDQAQFYLLRARAAGNSGDLSESSRYARISFDLHPTVEAGLLLAQNLFDEDRKDASLMVLSDPVFESADPWLKKQQMDLLFDLREPELAMVRYTELKDSLVWGLKTSEMATRLAEAGEIEEARTILDELADNEWNRTYNSRQLFEFELKFGNGDEALAAYRNMCAVNRFADPFVRDRLSLFVKHPALGWNSGDLFGALLLAALIVGTFCSPIVVLLPVHYWSLLRERRGKHGAWPAADWGLGAAWVAFGLLIMVEAFVLWYYQPGVLRGWFADSETEALVSNRVLLNSQILSWFLLVAVFVVLLRRTRNWSLLGAGDWGIAKSVAIGTACALGLRVLVQAYVSAWPESILGLTNSIQPATEQLMGAFLDEYGAFGLILSVGILVPIVEELLFRGVLLQALAKHLPFGWANFIQACVFAGWHENHNLMPFFIVFALVCGIATRRSRGLVAAIVIHAVNNVLVCITVIALDRFMA